MTHSLLPDDILKLSCNLPGSNAAIRPLIKNSKKLQYFFTENSSWAEEDAERKQLSSFEKGI